MKLITRDTDYALRALCFMAKDQNKITSVSELVRNLKIPRPFLRKILQRLNKKRVLKSHKGLGGGFKLAIAPRKLFLVELVETFQGPLRLNECFLKKIRCPNTKTCALKRKLDKIENHVTSELRSITVASLLR